MLNHPIVNHLVLGPSIKDYVPPNLRCTPVLALPSLRPILLEFSTEELREDRSTMFWAIIMGVVSEDTHPGLYQFVWNETMTSLSGLYAHKACDSFKDFLPTTAYDRLREEGLKRGEAWLFVDPRLGFEHASDAFQTNIALWQEFAGFNLLCTLILSDAPYDKQCYVANIIIENFEIAR